MKLTAAEVERTLSQFEAQQIPDDHPVVPQLNSLFGDHTFFLDANGLSILEPADKTTAGDRTGRIVNVADWSDEKRTGLVPHEPAPTDVVVVLGTEH